MHSNRRFSPLFSALVAFGMYAGLAAQAPLDGTAELQQAVEAVQAGRSETALNHLTSALAAGNLSSALRAQAHHLRGVILARFDRHNDAVADYTQALRIVPDIAWALANRGLSYAKLRQFDAAIADFDAAIGLMPDRAEVYLQRGNARFDMGDRPAAERDWTKAIELDPSAWLAWFNRCDLRRQDGRLAEAVSDCLAARERAADPRPVDTLLKAMGM